MLIEFSVGNYLSIKDRQTLRLDASSISEHRDQLIDAGRYKLLRSAVIYGANASGKSNVLKAMAAMRHIVITSAERSSAAEIEVEPFLLNTETENKPSFFEVLFSLNNILYRYGFEVDRKTVRTEWLFETKRKQEKPLLLRENDLIEVSKEFKEGKGLEDKTRDNSLFLAVCDQFNGLVARTILGWFSFWRILSGELHTTHRKTTFRLLEKEEKKGELMEFFKELDLGFQNMKFEEVPYSITIEKTFNNLSERGQRILEELNVITNVNPIHKKYNSRHEIIGNVEFDFNKNESSGTNKILDLSGPIFFILMNGGIIIIDELDAKLHPLITQAIIKLFNQPELNPNNAQLIFATHDTNLLSGKLFRRDQIYFTEKDQYGATSLYSLVEYQEEDGTKVRKDRSFEEDYIRGRYGAIPFIGDLSKIAS